MRGTWPPFLPPVSSPSRSRTRPSRMLSTATLDAAHANTTGPLFFPTTPCALASSTAPSMKLMSVRVLPVPGGPCHTDKVRPNARLTAAACDGLRVEWSVRLSAGARDLASASFPPHGGGTHAMLSRVPFPSGIPMSDRCRGAYAVELRRLPPGVVTRPGMPPGSEKATSAASALSCVMVLALRSMRSRRASSSLASSSSSTATFRKCMLRSTTTPWIPALPLPSHSSPSTSVTMSPCANR